MRTALVCLLLAFLGASHALSLGKRKFFDELVELLARDEQAVDNNVEGPTQNPLNKLGKRTRAGPLWAEFSVEKRQGPTRRPFLEDADLQKRTHYASLMEEADLVKPTQRSRFDSEVESLANDLEILLERRGEKEDVTEVVNRCFNKGVFEDTSLVDECFTEDVEFNIINPANGREKAKNLIKNILNQLSLKSFVADSVEKDGAVYKVKMSLTFTDGNEDLPMIGDATIKNEFMDRGPWVFSSVVIKFE